MNDTSVEIRPSQNKKILQLALNRIISHSRSYKFKTTEEASSFPLAQKILKIPGVETLLFIQDIIAIQFKEESSALNRKDDILNIVNQYLKKRASIITPGHEKEGDRVPVEVYSQMSDAGPGTLKFVCNTKLVTQKIQFDYNKPFQNAPLAKELFKFPYVKRVIFNKNHVLITKGGDVGWNEVMNELREFIRNYLLRGLPVLS